jgi:hypothetical protein
LNKVVKERARRATNVRDCRARRRRIVAGRPRGQRASKIVRCTRIIRDFRRRLNRRKIVLNQLETVHDTILSSQKIRESRICACHEFNGICDIDGLGVATRNRRLGNLNACTIARHSNFTRIKRHELRTIPDNVVARVNFLSRKARTTDVTREAIKHDVIDVVKVTRLRRRRNCRHRRIVRRNIGKSRLESKARCNVAKSSVDGLFKHTIVRLMVLGDKDTARNKLRKRDHIRIRRIGRRIRIHNGTLSRRRKFRRNRSCVECHPLFVQETIRNFCIRSEAAPMIHWKSKLHGKQGFQDILSHR